QAIVGGVQFDGTAVDVKSGATATVALRARNRVTVEGRVTDLATGAPIADAACHGSLVLGGREGPWIGTASRAQLSDANGRFSIAVPVGRDRVMCAGGGEWSVAGGDFEVTTQPAPVAVKSVKYVLPLSNPGFDMQPGVIPPTVAAVDANRSALAV